MVLKNGENCQKPNRPMKFSEILYVDASQTMKIHLIPDFRFWACLGFLSLFGLFWPKIEENCQNPNSLMKYSEIMYIDASQ